MRIPRLSPMLQSALISVLALLVLTGCPKRTPSEVVQSGECGPAGPEATEIAQKLNIYWKLSTKLCIYTEPAYSVYPGQAGGWGAFYHAPTDTTYLQGSMESFGSDPRLVYALAHEWGHAVYHARRLQPSPAARKAWGSKANEAYADCLAMQYLALGEEWDSLGLRVGAFIRRTPGDEKHPSGSELYPWLVRCFDESMKRRPAVEQR